MLDGATSAIDPALEVGILRRLKAELHDAIVLVVSPNPLVEGVADSLIDLSRGGIQVVP
jgi:ABC-type uncharacterized transport system fused permease/ATPase subunit